MTHTAIRITAPAKVNLHLAVGAVRDDGYHTVDTVLQSLAFGDTVTIETAPAFEFSCTADLGIADEDNLAFRAAHAMAKRFGRALEVRIEVEKLVPAGAGLGGASADAAAVIVGLAAWWGIGSDDPALVEVAAALGADVPFFLQGGAASFTGRGDVLVGMHRPLDAAIVLIKPDSPIATADAYTAFDRIEHDEAPAVAPLIEALESGSRIGVAHSLYNAMTGSSLLLVPSIGDALSLAGGCGGVIGSEMAGSGSAVFGICQSEAAAEACAARARSGGMWAAVTRTSAVGCVVSRVESPVEPSIESSVVPLVE